MLMSGTGAVLNLENKEGIDLPVLGMDPHGGQNQEFYFQNFLNCYFYITMLTEKTEKTENTVEPNLLLSATKEKVSMRKGGAMWRKGSIWRKVQIGQPYTWEPMASNELPTNALPAGKDADGGDTFLGLGEVDGKLTMGKVQDNTRYIIYPRGIDEKVVTSESFSVLSINKDYEAVWEEHKKDHIPELAVGEWIDGHTLFAGRGFIENTSVPGMFLPGRDYLYALHDGSAQKLYNFEVLTVIKKS